MEEEHTIDLPVTPEQAQNLLTEITLKPNEPEPVKVSHGLLLDGVLLPGRWLVYAVRREHLAGRPQHYASLRWEAPVP